MELVYKVEGGDFNKAGHASSQIKRVLKQLGVPPDIIKRVVVALYEAEVNIVAHAWRGVITAGVNESGIRVVLDDEGPGIPNIAQAMEKGYSTASPEVRDMGFGAGMGLPNIRANVDEFNITSEVNKGTVLDFFIKF
ncbi:MAG TPA: ATP-binding protein [Bacteroidales bacterium]|jgi:anti-sigma regulatory factor (Ser/Thr protein kinase)|nr:ATP-binding protein [Bacteroidales bacterium]HKM12261.1 ATP-binding protein [Bacteroidales bacterium]HPB89732.1 ATP-binding protein [Bacteroidales bacterium]HPY22175.1 ATP-binding protein [Bacteroidales bacterium]HQA93195.1 ATP-binding protein [Bacteroidales bacterium]